MQHKQWGNVLSGLAWELHGELSSHLNELTGHADGVKESTINASENCPKAEPETPPV
jgi:hypothetical protein